MIKSLIRRFLSFTGIDLTKNLEYDRLTGIILQSVLKDDSNTIDVGCHKGEILSKMLQFAPAGKHFGFEPIPDYFDYLKENFGNQATILPYAISDAQGLTSFQYVRNAPAFSGLKKRSYLVNKPDIEVIQVETRRLDDIVSAETKIDLIKIDVEGAEFGVLKGGKETIRRSKAIVIFECGLGASEHYGTDPGTLFEFIENELRLKVTTLKSFVKKSGSLSKEEFESCFNKNKEYYFVAFPSA